MRISVVVLYASVGIYRPAWFATRLRFPGWQSAFFCCVQPIHSYNTDVYKAEEFLRLKTPISNTTGSTSIKFIRYILVDWIS
jgi:hypothetical protein